MRHFLILSLLSFWLDVQAQDNTDSSYTVRVKHELRELLLSLNTAIKKHDRPALENIYADQFLFIHGFGYIDNKKAQLEDILSTDSAQSIPLPSFDNLYVNGNMALLRAPFRGPNGNTIMATTLYVKQKDRWQILQVQGTAQQRERKTVKIDPKILDRYTGKYEQSTGRWTIVKRTGDSLIMHVQGAPARLLLAVSPSLFFDKQGSEINFIADAGDTVTHYTIKLPNGQDVTWKKIDGK